MITAYTHHTPLTVKVTNIHKQAAGIDSDTTTTESTRTFQRKRSGN